MDLNALIGLDVNEAKKILNENNIVDIKIIMNVKEDVKHNTTLVCAVKQNKDCVTIVCGNFYFINEV